MSLIILLLVWGINGNVFDTSNNDDSSITVALASNTVVDSLERLKSSKSPAPPTKVLPKDKPNDAGGSIIVTWIKSADDVEGDELVKKYLIFRSGTRADCFTYFWL